MIIILILYSFQSLEHDYDHTSTTTKNPHHLFFLNGSLFFSPLKQTPPLLLPWLLKLTTFLLLISSILFIHGSLSPQKPRLDLPSYLPNHRPLLRSPDMTMVAALNHLSKHHPCGCADHLMNGGAPLCHQYYYYYYNYYLGSDHPHLLSLDPPMAEDDSTTNSLNDQAPSNKDDGWLQLSIGGSGSGGGVTGVKYDQGELIVPERTSGLVELDLLPGGGRDIPTSYSRWVSDFSSPETATTSKTGTGAGMRMGVETGIGMPLFFGTPSSSNFVQQEINWAFRPVAGIGTVARVPSSSSPSTSAVSSSYSLPVSSRRSSYLGRPLIQFQSVGADTATAGPSSDVRIISPPRRPHSGIWFTLKALENQ